MSILSSKFDIVSVENAVAVAALGVVLPVAAAGLGSPAFSINGTPTAGLIPPGSIVTMDAAGAAVLGSTGDIGTNPHTTKKMFFTVIDGNTDYSGAFTNKVTCLNGGFSMITDQYTAAAFTIGAPVTVVGGKITLPTLATQQLYGVVGPLGYDTTEGTLHVLVPQGGL